MLEGCYCERLITTNTNTKNKDTEKQVSTQSLGEMDILVRKFIVDFISPD